MELKTINWFALAAGILMLVLVVLSVFTPWWILQVGTGNGLATINAGPFYTNFSLLRLSFVIPILFAINVGIMALFAVSGITFIIYTFKANRGYSKHLLSYGWKRPLYTFVGFLVTLVVILYGLPMIINMTRGTSMVPVPITPLMGKTVMQLSSSMLGGGSGTGGIQIGVTVITAFTYTFYLGIAATVLGILARIYHRRIAPEKVVATPSVPVTPATVSQAIH